ncbi:MAG: hypothetical protein ACR2FE_02165 [Aeromicrobium sp.]
MPTSEYETSPSEVRTFALLQLGLTTVFLGLLFWALGGTDADLPPWWIIVALLLMVAISGLFAERVWLSARPLSPGVEPDQLRSQAVNVFAGQTVRKLAYCTVSVVFAVLVGFVGSYGGWPVLIGGLPSLVLIAFETWPSLRNTSITEAMLDAEGAESGLVESFRSW